MAVIVRKYKACLLSFCISSPVVWFLMLELNTTIDELSSSRWPNFNASADKIWSLINYSARTSVGTDDKRLHQDFISQSSTRRSVYSQTGISCSRLFSGDLEEQKKAKNYVRKNKPTFLSSDQLISTARNCSWFKYKRGYPSNPMSTEEASFSIAFSILVKGKANQVERLLRSIYAPQNYYCIHIDSKTDDDTKEAIRAVVSCFDNVFIASRLDQVFWGHMSIILAEMTCLNDLLQFPWKYYINLSGEMFPAHTNSELVQILKLFDGANDIEGTYNRSIEYIKRNKYVWKYIKFPHLNLMHQRTFFLKDAPPYNITIYKGSNNVAMSRAFAVYFMYSKRSRDIVEWFADTDVPDEYIWPTINHNPHLYAPGSYKGNPEEKKFTARGTIWLEDTHQIEWSWSHWKCHGKWVRSICIFGIGDMPWLFQRPELFLNKFYIDFEWIVYDCMEELIHNRTLTAEEAALLHQQKSTNLDLTYYKLLKFVENKTLVTSLEEAMEHWL